MAEITCPQCGKPWFDLSASGCKGPIHGAGFYHKRFSFGELANGVWEWGEFGNERGPTIHYLLVMTLEPDRKAVYVKDVDGRWLPTMEVAGCVRRMIKL